MDNKDQIKIWGWFTSHPSPCLWADCGLAVVICNRTAITKKNRISLWGMMRTAQFGIRHWPQKNNARDKVPLRTKPPFFYYSSFEHHSSTPYVLRQIAMEFFNLSTVTKEHKPIYDAIKKSVDAQRPKVPGYQLIPKVNPLVSLL